MRKLLLLALALTVAAGLVACGGSGETATETTPPGSETQSEGTTEGGTAEGGTAGSASVVDIETPEGSDLAYTTDEASAAAGEVTINFTNVQAIPHDVAIEDDAGTQLTATEVITEGSDSTKAELEPATYTFFCTIPGHREAGMEGTLTVE